MLNNWFDEPVDMAMGKSWIALEIQLQYLLPELYCRIRFKRGIGRHFVTYSIKSIQLSEYLLKIHVVLISNSFARIKLLKTSLEEETQITKGYLKYYCRTLNHHQK